MPAPFFCTKTICTSALMHILVNVWVLTAVVPAIKRGFFGVVSLSKLGQIGGPGQWTKITLSEPNPASFCSLYILYFTVEAITEREWPATWSFS